MSDIVSRPSNDKYREGWERAYGDSNVMRKKHGCGIGKFCTAGVSGKIIDCNDCESDEYNN